MTRQLIAFLALLSGLAALSGPAHASVISSVSCDVGVSAEANETKAGTPAGIREAAKKRPVRCRTVKTPKRIRLPESLRVPVAMGIERAYE
ncbi:hypothetical protein [uncultured Erythrobacter sp.]|uniref:hypothetical protein n=1 Tax=uncultured Erythrobacter sp. TaxID=263913 RepID=UPI002631D577|nr:hypothetical protein [uncultured Erythrobacter sp.]